MEKLLQYLDWKMSVEDILADLDKRIHRLEESNSVAIPAAEPASIDFQYQRTFNAIAAAASTRDFGGPIEISLDAFAKSFNGAAYAQPVMTELLKKIDIAAQAGLCAISHTGTREFLKDIRVLIREAAQGEKK